MAYIDIYCNGQDYRINSNKKIELSLSRLSKGL